MVVPSHFLPSFSVMYRTLPNDLIPHLGLLGEGEMLYCNDVRRWAKFYYTIQRGRENPQHRATIYDSSAVFLVTCLPEWSVNDLPLAVFSWFFPSDNFSFTCFSKMTQSFAKSTENQCWTWLSFLKKLFVLHFYMLASQLLLNVQLALHQRVSSFSYAISGLFSQT